MKLPVTWMREFVDAPDDPKAVAARLAGCGFEVASIDGDVIDFEITANRPDCLSVYGLAREAATAFDLDLKPLVDDAADSRRGTRRSRSRSATPAAAGTRWPSPRCASGRRLTGSPSGCWPPGCVPSTTSWT